MQARLKTLFNEIFIEGLSGMATGLFATLIVGTIIQQIGSLVGGGIGDMIFLIGKVAAAMTGAGIGVGVACRFKGSPLVVVSAGIAGDAKFGIKFNKVPIKLALDYTPGVGCLFANEGGFHGSWYNFGLSCVYCF